MKRWIMSGSDVKGDFKNYENLTFLKINDASHWVGRDKPEEIYAMLM